MATTRLAIKALGEALGTAINNANISLGGVCEVRRGWPDAAKLRDLLQKPTPQAQVSVYPLRGKPETRYHPTIVFLTRPQPGTTYSLDTTKTVLTISGTPYAGDTIHAFFGNPLKDANHLVVTGNQTTTIASAIAASANAQGVSGVTATASGSSVTLTGATWSRINIGATAQAVQEITRVDRLVQCSVWANTDDARMDVTDAILTAVGGTNTNFLTADDGSQIWTRYGGDAPSDAAQQSYSSFRWDCFFAIEYGLTRSISVTQVEAIQGTVVNDDGSPVTFITGGST